MPFTFFAHQLFVLPLKATWPRRFDGTALCLGSMAPDFAYALSGTPLAVSGHTPLSLAYWTLPVSLVLTHITRQHLATAVGRQLAPPYGTEIRVLAKTRHHWSVTWMSALVGGMTHIVVDAFTHPGSWAWNSFAFLRHSTLPGCSVADTLQYLGHTLGTTVGVWWFAQLIHRGSLSAWSTAQRTPPVQPTRRDRAQLPAPQSARSSSYLPICSPGRGATRFWRGALSGTAFSTLLGLTDFYFHRNLPTAIIRASLYSLAFLWWLSLKARQAEPQA